jgi:hypothetical protein
MAQAAGSVQERSAEAHAVDLTILGEGERVVLAAGELHDAASAERFDLCRSWRFDGSRAESQLARVVQTPRVDVTVRRDGCGVVLAAVDMRDRNVLEVRRRRAQGYDEGQRQN